MLDHLVTLKPNIEIPTDNLSKNAQLYSFLVIAHRVQLFSKTNITTSHIKIKIKILNSIPVNPYFLTLSFAKTDFNNFP